MNETLARYNKGNPCPVCSSGSKNCSVTTDGYQRCRGDHVNPGWKCIHQGETWNGFRRESELKPSARSLWYTKPPRPKLKPATPKAIDTKAGSGDPPKNWEVESIRATTALTPRLRTELAKSLGVPTEATYLVKHLGYIPEPIYLLDGKPINPGHWTFPEADAAGQIIGILSRYRDGCSPIEDKNKLREKHSQSGLSLPIGWRDNPGPLVNVEGPTDALAAAHAGLASVGRHTNTGGADQLTELLHDWPADRPIIIVGENDARPSTKRPGETEWPGQLGALTIARKLTVALQRPILIAYPPVGYKDVRDYLTSDEWGNTPWDERGRRLLAHLTTTAETFEQPAEDPTGQDTATSPSAGRDAESPFAAGAAAAEVIDLLTPTCWCKDIRMQIVERISTGKLGAIPFGCHRTTCPTCGMFKRRDLFESTETYLPRVTATNTTDAMVGGMALYAAVVPTERLSAVFKAIRKLKGEYLGVHTSDPDGCLEKLGTGDIRHMAEEDICRKVPHTLVAAVLPVGTAAPDPFAAATVAQTFLAIGHGLVTTPTPDASVKRYRPWTKSRGWGDEIIKEPSDIKVKCPDKFDHAETREMLEELGQLVQFWFGDPTIQGKPLGIGGTPGQSLCLSMLLGLVGAPGGIDRPDISKVTDLGRDWIRVIPESVGSGPQVYTTLRKHLWVCPLLRLTEIRDELLEADAKDRTEARLTDEYGPSAYAYVMQTVRQPWVSSLIADGVRALNTIPTATVKAVRDEIAQLARERLDGMANTSFLAAMLKDEIVSRIRDKVTKAVNRKIAKVVRDMSRPANPPEGDTPSPTATAA